MKSVKNIISAMKDINHSKQDKRERILLLNGHIQLYIMQ